MGVHALLRMNASTLGSFDRVSPGLMLRPTSMLSYFPVVCVTSRRSWLHEYLLLEGSKLKTAGSGWLGKFFFQKNISHFLE